MATKNDTIIAALQDNGWNPREAYKAIRGDVGVPPLDFTFNPGNGSARLPRVLGAMVDPDLRSSDPTGARKNHSDRTQHEMCLRMCYAVARGGSKGKPPVAPTSAPAPSPEPAPTPEPKAASLPAEVERFLREVERYRREVEARGNFDPMESMRITLEGVKAIKAGVPVDGLLASIGAPWPEETRKQIGVPTFDYAAWGKRQPEYDPAYHAAMPYVLRLAKAGLLVYLHGPAGTGKSTIAQGVAAALDREYHEMNLAGAMASAIRGKVTPQGVMTDTAFIKAYSQGGVLGAEELDASHPNVLTTLNNSLANGHFANDVDGKVYPRSKDFVMIATGNTLMNGATKQFSGRMNIDGATKDRFRMGLVNIRRDAALERRAIDSILAA